MRGETGAHLEISQIRENLLSGVMVLSRREVGCDLVDMARG